MSATRFHLLSMFRYCSYHTLFPLFYWAQSTQTSVLAVFLFSSFSRAHSFYLALHVITTEITSLKSNLLENILKLKN